MRKRSVAVMLLSSASLLVAANVAMNVPQGEWFPASVIGLWLLCVAGVGSAGAINRSDNPIGWIMLVVALCVGGGLFVEAYASLGAFASRLRDEIEVDAVRWDVLGVVGGTLNPAHASVWMRPEASR